MTVSFDFLSIAVFGFHAELQPPQPVQEEPTSSHSTASDADVVQKEPLTLADRIAVAGFRSPSTINMLQRLHRSVVAGLSEEAGAEVEAVLGEMVDLAGDLAATDDRPFGRSIEHQLKQLFNGASRKHPVLPQVEIPSEPATDGVIEDQVVSEVEVSDLALDVQV